MNSNPKVKHKIKVVIKKKKRPDEKKVHKSNSQYKTIVSETTVDFFVKKFIDLLKRKVIIRRFDKNLKDKSFIKSKSDPCGQEGHYVEKLMGIKPNCKNNPDLLGYECKKYSPVITFIDKQTDHKYYEGTEFKSKDLLIKTHYWNTFARSNSKDLRIGGWKLNKFDNDGQCLKLDDHNNINIVYNFNHDKRHDKNKRVSNYYHNYNDHIIGTWCGKTIKKTIEDKFNQNGFFICKSVNGIYTELSFGRTINFEEWIESFKQQKIYYDGYSKLNEKNGKPSRWRGSFRASKKWWDNLLIK